MEHSPPNCNYETFTIHTNSLGASSNTSFLSTFTRPIKDVVEASVISASIRRPDVVHFTITNTVVTSASALTVTHGQLSKPLVATNQVTITGHTATPQDIALNQVYTVASITSPTVTVLTPTTPFDFFPALTLDITNSAVTALDTTECTVTYADTTAQGRPPRDGEQVTITGHTGTPQDTAMNQVYTVKSGTTPSTTSAVLIGSGMTPAIDINILEVDTSLNIDINSITTDPLLVIDLTSVTTTSPTAGSVIYTATTRAVQVGEIFNVVGWDDPTLNGPYTVINTPTATTFDFTSTGMNIVPGYTLGSPQGTASAVLTGTATITPLSNGLVRNGEVFTVSAINFSGAVDLSGTYTVTGTPTATSFAFTAGFTVPPAVGTYTGTGTGVATTTSAGRVTNYTNAGTQRTGAVEVGEEITVAVTGTPSLDGTYTVVADPPPTASTFSYTTPTLSAVVTGVVTGGTGVNNGVYNTPANVSGTTRSVYNRGIVLAATNVIVAPTSNVVYIRAEELETDFIDFAAAGQPAVATAAAPFNFTTGSNLLRRCFGAIYFVDDKDSKRFSYKDRYNMVSQYINPLRSLDKLRITLYDANGAVLDTTQSDGITYLTFEFKCLRQNLCNFNRCN